MGRKRIPAALKILRGNPGKRAINLDEPQPDPLPITVPDELTADAVARAEWTRTIVPAIQVGHITSADRVLAIAHCESFSTWRAQSVDAAAAPHVIKRGIHATPAPNPVRGMAHKTLSLLLQIDDKLGLTPTSRSKVAATVPRTNPTPLDRHRATVFDPTGRG